MCNNRNYNLKENHINHRNIKLKIIIELFFSLRVIFMFLRYDYFYCKDKEKIIKIHSKNKTIFNIEIYNSYRDAWI